jgi:hypothetical protein
VQQVVSAKQMHEHMHLWGIKSSTLEKYLCPYGIRVTEWHCDQLLHRYSWTCVNRGWLRVFFSRLVLNRLDIFYAWANVVGLYPRRDAADELFPAPSAEPSAVAFIQLDAGAAGGSDDWFSSLHMDRGGCPNRLLLIINIFRISNSPLLIFFSLQWPHSIW